MLPTPIGIKYNFIGITNLRWPELEIMEDRRNFNRVVKCGIGGWHVLRFSEGGFVGSLNLLQNLDAAVYVVDLLEHYPRQALS